MKRIVLIGAPGSGKSTIGASLGKHLDRAFLDTDVLIEKEELKSISDIFLDEGEEFFRKVELEVLRSTLLNEDCVISLGGGAPISIAAQDLIRNSDSIVVFLDVSLATAAPRVGFNRDRPLLLGNPRAQWQALSDARRPIYENLANHSIKVDGMSVNEIVDAIESVVS